VDRFQAELEATHAYRQEIRDATPAQRDRIIAALGMAADDWGVIARDAQLPPADIGWAWLLMGGRGMGKTRSLSGAVHMAIRAGIRRIHFIAPTTSDCIDVNIDGPAGILATHGRDPRPKWISTRRRLEWSNGAQVTFFSGEEPESLRGPQCEMALIDELARMRHQDHVFNMMMMGNRLGDRPRVFIATTPKATPLMKRLVKMDDLSITTGTTYDNAVNLAPSFIKQIREMYEGTRLGRQELQGTLILDPQYALFKEEWFHYDQVSEDTIELITVGVDPSGGADDVGIVVAALLNDGRLAVLADRSISGTPSQWGDAVIQAHDDYDADDVVVETNFGGQMAVEVVKQAARRAHEEGRRLMDIVHIRTVTASRGKAMRAEPISLIYEKGRVLHRPGMDQLEVEMMQFSRDFDRDKDGSPNRLDAAVWALTRLSKVITELAIA